MRGQEKARKRLVAGLLTGILLAGAAAGMAQEKPSKVAIINIQVAILQTNDGQKAAKEIQTRFAPKEQELTKAQQEINALQDQLRNQEKTLSDDARNKLLKSIDEKTRLFNRNNEDATAEFQSAQNDAYNEIGQKMMPILGDYAQKNNFTLVMDVSAPQTPVLWVDPATDITKTIVDLYNQATATPAAAAAPATPAAAPIPATPPAAAAPAGGANPATTP